MKKKIIFFGGLLFMVFVGMVIYLNTKLPSVEILPEKYKLHKLKSFDLYYVRFRIYKINRRIKIEDIKTFPKSGELETGGYGVEHWRKFDNQKDKYIIDYILELHKNCHCYLKEVENLLKELKNRNNEFYFSKFALEYFFRTGKYKDEGATYFYLIDNKKQLLYKFETLPNM